MNALSLHPPIYSRHNRKAAQRGLCMVDNLFCAGARHDQSNNDDPQRVAVCSDGWLQSVPGASKIAANDVKVVKSIYKYLLDGEWFVQIPSCHDAAPSQRAKVHQSTTVTHVHNIRFRFASITNAERLNRIVPSLSFDELAASLLRGLLTVCAVFGARKTARSFILELLKINDLRRLAPEIGLQLV